MNEWRVVGKEENIAALVSAKSGERMGFDASFQAIPESSELLQRARSDREFPN